MKEFLFKAYLKCFVTTCKQETLVFIKTFRRHHPVCPTSKTLFLHREHSKERRFLLAYRHSSQARDPVFQGSSTDKKSLHVTRIFFIFRHVTLHVEKMTVKTAMARSRMK